jgi:hypothetical protein
MRIVRSVFTGMAFAIAGIMTFSMADAALAKTKKQTSTAQPQLQSSRAEPTPAGETFRSWLTSADGP